MNRILIIKDFIFQSDFKMNDISVKWGKRRTQRTPRRLKRRAVTKPIVFPTPKALNF